ncbi:MAG: universal stress protein [Deltaproteobacteria bacterium]|nr:universal stress protein [Deltaproteobacteria bacterium]MBT4641241.1 universal stress protein [Deltaproteobacteria bacterium]MBT6499692.1 universal stress protein [Deltaproteobacteria bacterium]MBT6615748.1 universal stress protein [Deltaproteobacteria bacterium]MBT7715526.1 universal stress protein [Deltaproteobacteria bacterium]
MVTDIKKILFITDLTDSAKIVFEQAATLAVQLGASLSILHVIEDTPVGRRKILVDLIGSETYERVQNEAREAARNAMIGKRGDVPVIREALIKLSKSVAPIGDCMDNGAIIGNIDVRVGNVVEEIMEFAKSESADMIVMGHHQKSMLLRAMTGSTVKHILRISKIPIHLVPVAY